jgi:protein phosphatase
MGESMAGPFSLSLASWTDRGRVREHNEDALACDALAGIAVLADGMGGYAAGEVASGVAAAQIAADLARVKAEYPSINAPDLVQAMRDAIMRANHQIYRAARQDPRYAGMGTTLVAAAFSGRALVLGHAGDSRAYLLRQRRLSQLTRDHSLLQEQIDMGLLQPGDAAARAVKNLVTRALGVDPELDPEFGVYVMMRGDVVLLCSDGLSDMLSDARIEALLNEYPGDGEAAARRLVQEANLAGGRDNISVIIAQVNEKSEEKI